MFQLVLHQGHYILPLFRRDVHSNVSRKGEQRCHWLNLEECLITPPAQKKQKKLVCTFDLKSTHSGARCHLIHAYVAHTMSGPHWLFIHKRNIRPWNTAGYEKPFLLPPITLTSGCLCIHFVRQRVRTSLTTSPQCCRLMHIHAGSSPEKEKGGREGGADCFACCVRCSYVSIELGGTPSPQQNHNGCKFWRSETASITSYKIQRRWQEAANRGLNNQSPGYLAVKCKTLYEENKRMTKTPNGSHKVAGPQYLQKQEGLNVDI